MAVIAIFSLPEISHLFSFFGLARKLKEHNHRVIFFARPQFKQVTLRNGFDFHPIDWPTELDKVKLSLNSADYLEKSSLGVPDGTDSFQIKSLNNTRIWMSQKRQEFTQSRKYWSSNYLDKLLMELSVDLMMVDSLLSIPALIGYRLGIPCIYLSSTLPQIRVDGIPPFTTHLIPGVNGFNRINIELAWLHVAWNKFVARLIGSIFSIDNHYYHWMVDIATHSNYPPHKIQKHTVYIPNIKIPQLILCPKEFDFPQPVYSDFRYTGPCIDNMRTDNRESNFRYNSDKPLIYYSMGSRIQQGSPQLRILESFIGAMNQRRDLNAIAVVNHNIKEQISGQIPNNVSILDWVPQIEILKKSILMVTHGGLGSIKECIYRGVPMIVCPIERDQPGNAARVAYHGLGVNAKSHKPSTTDFLKWIDLIEHNPIIRQSINKMQDIFVKAEKSNHEISLIEKILAQ